MNNPTRIMPAMLLAAALSFSTSCPALASAEQRPMLGVTVGEVGIGDSLSEPLRFGVDFRFHPQGAWKIAPAVGAAFAENGAAFVYADLRRDFRLAERWLLTPSFGVGSFDDGQGLNLGSELEFRSGLELSREIGDRFRLGLAVYHLSNGGIADRNPGTESLVLSFNAAM